jgi:hypothetical protein
MAEEYASQATDWAGSTLSVGDGASPENFTDIAELTKISFGAMTTGKTPVTHLLSPNAHVEKIPGMRDTDDFGLEGNWRPEHATQSNSSSGAGGLVYLARTRAVRNFKITLGGSGSPAIEWPFRGFVSNFKPGDAMIGNAKTFTGAITPSQDIAEDLP